MSITDSHLLRYAKQTTGLDQNVTSGLLNLCTEGVPEIASGMVQNKIDRNLNCGDVQKTARVNGAKGSSISFTTEAYGCYTAGSDGVAAVSSESLKPLFEALFGAAESVATGDTVSSASGTEITVAGNLSDNDYVLLAGADSGDKQVRQIVSGGGTTTPDLDRALTNSGSTEDAATGTVWGGVTYALTNTNVDRDTLMFDFEGDTTRHRVRGVTLGTLTITIPSDGGKVMCAWSGEGNDFDADQALANPTFSAENDGSPIVALDSPVWLGATEYMVRDLTVTVTLRQVRRATQLGVNGYHGHGTVGADVTVSGGLYLGSDTYEAAKAFKETLNASESTQDLLIQVGRDAGACMAIHIPACDFTATQTSFDGLDGLQIEGIDTRTSDGGNTPCRVTFF
jgi:hypothetical protein